MLLLEVRHVNRRAQFRAKIRVLDVADNSNYRDLSTWYRRPTLSAVDGQLRSAAYRRKRLTNAILTTATLGWPFASDGVNSLPTRMRLMQCGKVARRDAGLFKIHVLFFSGLVPLYREVGGLGIARELRVGGGGYRNYARECGAALRASW